MQVLGLNVVIDRICHVTFLLKNSLGINLMSGKKTLTWNHYYDVINLHQCCQVCSVILSNISASIRVSNYCLKNNMSLYSIFSLIKMSLKIIAILYRYFIELNEEQDKILLNKVILGQINI